MPGLRDFHHLGSPTMNVEIFVPFKQFGLLVVRGDRLE